MDQDILSIKKSLRLVKVLLGFMLLIVFTMSAYFAEAMSSNSKAIIATEQSSITLPYSVTVLSDFMGKPIIKLIFFTDQISDEAIQTLEAAKVLTANNIEKIAGIPPVFEISFWFKKETTVGDIADLVSYNIIVYNSEQFQLPIQKGKYFTMSFASQNMAQDNYGISELQCDLAAKTIQAKVNYEKLFQHQAMQANYGISEMFLKWDVQIDVH